MKFSLLKCSMCIMYIYVDDIMYIFIKCSFTYSSTLLSRNAHMKEEYIDVTPRKFIFTI